MGTGDVPTTHYDNLKVARDAPSEVIRAAYRALTQRYHPDRNPDPEAARIMQIINRAYEVLSDPEPARPLRKRPRMTLLRRHVVDPANLPLPRPLRPNQNRRRDLANSTVS